MSATATFEQDSNDVEARCLACSRTTISMVTIHVGDLWLGNFPMCDDCHEAAQ